MRRPVDAERVWTLARELARSLQRPATLYLVGGATAVTQGWRANTIDVDLVLEPEDDAAMRVIPELKDRLGINIELASPLDFLPELPGWRDRSPFVEQVDSLTVRQFDPYSQALAKVERGFAQDEADVRAMIDLDLVDPARLVDLFDTIEDRLYRFPSVDAIRLRARVEALTTRG
jgi:hypothetical protein